MIVVAFLDYISLPFPHEFRCNSCIIWFELDVQPTTFSFQISCSFFLGCNIQFFACDIFVDFPSPISVSRITRISHQTLFLNAVCRINRLCCTLMAKFNLLPFLTIPNCDSMITCLVIFSRDARSTVHSTFDLHVVAAGDPSDNPRS